MNGLLLLLSLVGLGAGSRLSGRWRAPAERWDRRRPVLRLAQILGLAWPLAAGAAETSFNPRSYLEGSGYRAQRDSVVLYRADSLFMDAVTRRTLLQGKASIRFQGLLLDSPFLELNWERNRVEAWTGDADPAGDCGGSLALGGGQRLGGEGQRNPGSPAPEPGSPADSLERMPWPVFRDGTQTLYGHSMSLDLRTRQGRVLRGRTSEDPSRYGGTRIKRVADQEMHVQDAIFTTCDEDCPHYHFQARQLKMLLKDRVLARDVTLHYGRVPTLYSPVALFSLKRGRASGLILPSYGQTEREGRKIDHLGWYWAASDYWDTQLKLSYAENGPDWLLVNETLYRMNAADRGRLSASYNLARTSAREGWDLRWSHNQALTPYIQLRGDVRLASSRSYYGDTSDNLETRLTRNLTSNLSLAGRFPSQQISWTLGANATQDLADEEGVRMTGTAPSFSLRFPNTTPLAFLNREGEGGPLAAWLAGGLLTVGSTAQSRFSMLGWNLWEAENRRGAQHSAAFSIPGKLGPVSLTPRLNASSDWVDETRQLRRLPDGGLDTLTVPGFAARTTYSLGLNASTKLYGVARPELGRLLALRHVLTPSAGLSWAPDFSTSGWGYVSSAEYQGAEGPARARLDRFAGSLYGGTSARRTLRMNFGLDQLVQGKWRPPDRQRPGSGGLPPGDPAGGDSLNLDGAPPTGGGIFGATQAPEPLKTDLFSLNTTSSYDFTRDSLRLGDLSTRWSADPLQALGASLGPLNSLRASMSTVHAVHKSDSTGRSLGRYTWQSGYGQAPRWPRLTSTSVTVATSLGGRGGGGDAFLPPPDTDGERFDPVYGDEDLSIPWNLNLSWTWTRNSADPRFVRRTQFVSATGSIRVTPNWKLSSGLHYDIENRSFSANSIQLYRDLHCWEGRFTWNPRGPNPSYHLLITVKAEMLRDLKWDKRKGRSGFAGSF
jgi:hypothetical protein